MGMEDITNEMSYSIKQITSRLSQRAIELKIMQDFLHLRKNSEQGALTGLRSKIFEQRLRELNLLTGSLSFIDDGLANISVGEHGRGLNVIPVLAGEGINTENREAV